MADRSRHTYELDVDKRKLDKGLKDTEKQFKETSDKGFKAFGTKLVTGIAAAGVALGGLYVGFKKLVGIASEAEETTSKFGVVYQDAIVGADAATANLVKNFGLSNLQAEKLLSNTGDLLTGFGFTGSEALGLADNVQQLAVDLASFTNAAGGAEAVSNALTKALLGERESLKTYGIAIREADVQQILLAKGQDKLVGLALQQAKAYATLEIATRQSKNAVGDFARTSDSFANLQRQLSADLEDVAVKLGKVLLPAATSVVRAFRGIVDVFDDLLGLDMPSEMEKINDAAEQQAFEFDTLQRTYELLAEKVELTAGEQELLAETVDKLQTQYPNYLKNIDFERDGYEKISEALKEAGKQLDLYLKKRVQQAILAEQEAEFIELGKQIIANQKTQAQLQVQINKANETYGDSIENGIALTAEQRRVQTGLNEEFVGTLQFLETDSAEAQQKMRDEIQKTKDIINTIFADVEPPTTKTGQIVDEWVKIKEVLEDVMMTEEEFNELEEQLLEEHLDRIKARQSAEKDAAKIRKADLKAQEKELKSQGKALEDVAESIGSSFTEGLVDQEGFKEALGAILVTIVSFIQKQVLAAQVAAGARAVFGDFSGLLQIAGVQALFELLKVAVASFAVGVENFEGGFARVHSDETVFVPQGSNVLTKRESKDALGRIGGADMSRVEALLEQLIVVETKKKLVLKGNDAYEMVEGAKKNVLGK